MKVKKRVFTFLLALSIALLPTIAFADESKDESGNETQGYFESIKNDLDELKDDINNDVVEKTEDIKEKLDADKEKLDVIKDDLKDNLDDIDVTKEAEDIKEKLEADKDNIELLKEDLENLKNDLEAQYEAAKESGDESLATSLLSKIDSVNQLIEENKLQIKEKIEEMKEAIKQQYTEEEWAQLEAAAKILKSKVDLTVLPVENVLFTDGEIKFDTPPVIVEGSTLISIRSIAEALGAEVNWDDENKIATIVYGDTTIKFNTDDGTVYVNGEEVDVNSSAEVINDQIVVPLRFVVENMGLNIDWDQDTQTIIISK